MQYLAWPLGLLAHWDTTCHKLLELAFSPVDVILRRRLCPAFCFPCVLALTGRKSGIPNVELWSGPGRELNALHLGVAGVVGRLLFAVHKETQTW